MSRQASGHQDDPVVFNDSSDEDKVNVANTQASSSRRTSSIHTQNSRNEPVDLTLTDSSEDNNNITLVRPQISQRRKSSSPSKRRRDKETTPLFISTSDEESALPEASTSGRQSKVKVEPASAPADAGTWLNPTVITPPVGTWLNPTVITPDFTNVRTSNNHHPKSTPSRPHSTSGTPKPHSDPPLTHSRTPPIQVGSSDDPTLGSPQNSLRQPLESQAPLSGNSACLNPTFILPTSTIPPQSDVGPPVPIPDGSISGIALDSSQSLVLAQPIPIPQVDQHLQAARPVLDESTGDGTWLNPRPIVPSYTARIPFANAPSSNGGASASESSNEAALGSWLNPTEIRPSLTSSVKRVASPGSPERSDAENGQSRRTAKSRRIESPNETINLEETVRIAPSQSSASTSRPARPRWTTSEDEAVRIAAIIPPVIEPLAPDSLPITGNPTAVAPMLNEWMEVDSTPSSRPPASLHASDRRTSPPRTTQSQIEVEQVLLPNEPSAKSLAEASHSTAVPDASAVFATVNSNMDMDMDTGQDIKPVIQGLGIPPLLFGSAGASFDLPIEIELDDDDLADLNSNDDENEINSMFDKQKVAATTVTESTDEANQQLDEAVDDVRIGIDEVDIGPPVPTSPQSSSAPSIEEIQAEDMPSSSAGPSKRSRRISERMKAGLVPDWKTPAAQAMEAIRTRRQSKAKRDSNASRPISISSGERSVSPHLQVVIPIRTREEWRRLVETEGETDVEDILDDDESSLPSSRPSHGVEAIGLGDMTIKSIFHIPSLPPIPDPPIREDRQGPANRILDTRLIDDWNRRKPHLTNNPSLHRAVFEAYMAQCTSVDEPLAEEIKVVNTVDGEGAPPDFEFQYSNDMLYNPEVPDPELSLGCDCDGPCDPDSTSCTCVKRQKLYFYDLGMSGFAYDQDGRIKETSVSVWECSKTCGCPPECMNRVIQRGRGKYTQIELFKTRLKGWGIRASSAIPAGTFLGIYAGEFITEQESEDRGNHYAKLGRTYLFDCDGWQISNPPEGLENIDPRAAELADAAAQRARQAAMEADDPAWVYSAYSVDAFHYGFTRYFNHSCDPNLAITQAYVKDFHPERPILVMFARRAIRAGEELCISYKGLPDDEEDVRPAVPLPKLGRKGKKSSKTSASAHMASAKSIKNKVAAKDRCMCGTARCDGRMFNYGD